MQETSEEGGSEGSEQVEIEIGSPTRPISETLDAELNELVAEYLDSHLALAQWKSGALGAGARGRSADPRPPEVRDQQVRVLIWTEPSSVASVQRFLRANGADDFQPRADAAILASWVPVSLLLRLSRQAGVTRIEVEPRSVAAQDGATAHGATRWQNSAFGADGQGVSIAIIDAGFAGYSPHIGTELPTPAGVYCYLSDGTDVVTTIAECEADSGTDKHGTWVTEYAYDVAPDASYYLVRVAHASELHGAMAWLAKNQVDVINMSIQCLCWDGPGDGTSYHALTYTSFVDRAAAQGMTVVISAGNTAGRSWFARGYNDPDADGWLDWADGDECNSFRFRAGDVREALVRWDDVWRRATTDLDVYVTHSDSFEVVAKGERVQNGGRWHIPTEVFRFEVPRTGSYCLAVKANGGAAPGWVQAYVTQADLEHDNPATSLISISETKSPGTLVVGAAPWDDTDTIERFSSRGPTIDGRIKPDLVGADGVASQIEGGGNRDRLLGTSFAAPHVAGLAALVKQRNPWFTSTEIAGYLKDTALARGDTSPNSTWGHGFANLPGEPAEGKATIGGGSPVVGTALQADLSGHTEPDSPAGASSYQWLRVTELGTAAIASAVGASYTPVAADVGAKLRVRVSYTDNVSSEEEFLSDTTHEVQAQPTTLVSSVAQSSTSTEVDLQAGTRVAQRFTTGTQGSVDLKAVELDVAAALSAGSTYTVKLHGANTSNADEPGDAIAVLDGTLTATGTRTFTPLSATVLSASTTYWIVVEVAAVSGTPTDHGRLAYKTGDTSLTLTTGWTLPQSSLRRAQSATSWTTVNERIGLAVKGLVRPSAPKFSANLYPGDTATRSVTENATGGNVGLPIAALGVDGATLVYSVTATSDGDGATHLSDFKRDFEVDSATGQISVRPGAAINFEARAAYKVIFEVSDSKDSSGNTETAPTADDTLTLTVQVRNVNEGGQVRITGHLSPVGQTLTASVNDPDGSVTDVVWQWERSNQRSQGYVDIPNATSATYTTTTADSQRFVRARATYTDGSGGRQAEYGFFGLPVGVVEESFVSNLGEAENPPAEGFENEGLAFQGFMTGSNPAGYALTKVGVIGVEASATHMVEIWTSTGDSAATYEPGRRLYGLIRPSSVPAANTPATYHAYIEAILDPDTVYYVAYLDFPKVAYDEASATVAYDTTPATGWSLLNGSARWNPDAGDGGDYEPSTKRLPIEVKGAPLVGTPSEARSLAATAGAEAVELAWDSPEFDRGRTVSKYQVRHKKKAEAEWEYSQWSDVADGPDDGTDEDDERSTRVSGLTVDVEYTFQVRAVSELGNGDPAEISVETDHSDPSFPTDAASRTVAENTVSGDLGAALVATELDGDTLRYSVAATSETGGAAILADFNRDFELDAATGQVSVKADASIDFETRPSYKVVVQVSDGEDSNGDAETDTPTVDDTIELTVTVTDADDDGEVVIAGTAHVDAVVTASLDDDDDPVSSVSWQWARGDSADGSFTDISSETASTYTVVADDLGKFLRATATYTDAFGPSKTAAATSAAVVANPHTVPAFSAETASLSVAENTASGNVGDAVAATDDDGDGLTYSVVATSQTDAAADLADFNRDFEVDAATGQVSVKAGARIDYETRSTYKVLVQVTDGEDNLGGAESPATVDDTITLTITVTNADDPGTVSISGNVHVDATLSASVTDLDGMVSSVTWQWARGDSADGSFTDISTATSSEYTLVADDLNKYLRATASYTDPQGSNKTAVATTAQVAANPHTVPAFSAETASRSVAENTTSGDVGDAVAATDADSDTLTYSVAATSETDAADNLTAFNRDFALNSATGQITVKSGAQIDYETRSTYTVVIEVTDGEGILGGTESGTPTVDDTITLTITVTDADDAGTVTITGTAHVDATLTASVTDPDGTVSSITWQWARGDTADGSFTDISTATSSTYTLVADDLNKYLRATATYTDPLDSGRTAAATTSQVMANPYTVPAFSAQTATLTVAENTASGDVGTAITATDADSDTLTYSVAATSELDAEANLTDFNRDFALSSTTGQVSVKAGAQIDYETRSTYKVLIEVTDKEDKLGATESPATVDDTLTLTITVTNADEAGTVTITGTAHVDVTLTASVTDPDGTASSITWKWARASTANGPYTDIATATNTTYTLVADDLDKYLRATATYTDPLGSSKTAAATTAKVVVNPHTMPAFASDTAARSVAENTTSGNLGDAITATDTNGDTLTYSVAATSEADAEANLTAFKRDFALNAATGQITVKSGAQIDYETRSTYKVLIEVTDSEDKLGATESPATVDDTITLTITVTNVDEAGTVTISGTAHVDATLTATVADLDGMVSSVTWKWARGDTADGSFTPISTATSSTYTLVADDLNKFLRATATYTDPQGSNKTAVATTAKVVANPNIVPEFGSDTAARTVAENTTSGNVGAAITATDTSDDTLTYSVAATSDADAADDLAAFKRDFSLNSTTGQVSVNAGAQIDYETRTTYKVLIEVTDSEDKLGATESPAAVDDTLTLTITVTNVDEAGTVTTTGTAHVDATVTASVTDPDGTASSITWKWARGDTADGPFTDISTATSAAYTVVADDLNKFLRATASYTDPLAANKTASATTEKVTANPNTVPKFASDTASRTVAENTTSGNVGAPITATDTDGDTLAYSVAATSETDAADNLTAFNRDFALNTATGQITVKPGAQIDYETRSTYKVVIRVTDSEDNLGNTETGNPTIDDTLTLTITVTDANDPGEVTISGTTHVDATLTASVTDPDGAASSITWKWARGDTESGPFTDITTATSSTYTLVADDLNKYLRATASYTDPLAAGKTASATTAKVVANPNTMPEFADATATRTVAENTTSGNVGAAITATDTDNDTRTYSVAATSDADAAADLTAFNRDFALNAATGQITVKSGAQIDYETRSTYKVLIEVTDSEDNLGNTESGDPTIDDSLTLTITVTNADDPGEAAISGIPHIDATLTASVTDPDGSVSSITWKWARGNTASGPFTDISGETGTTYTVVDGDLDKFLRATATYTDAFGSNKTAEAVTSKVTASPYTRPAFSAETAARTVAENTTSGNVGDAITATDADSDTLAYSVAATSETNAADDLTAFNRDFALNAATGQITVKPGAAIDYETRTSYKVLIQVTDSEDNLGNTESGNPTIDDSLTLTITVTDADDAGTVTITGTAHVDATLTASVADPDGTASSITWKWARASTANGPYTDISTATSATYTVVAGDLGKFLRATASYTDPLAAGKTASATTAKVTANPNTVPKFASDTASRTVAENTTSGNVGAVVTATDTDGDTLAYSVAATSETDAAANLTAFNRDFALNAATGQITAKAGAQIDYETRTTYKVLIEVTDSEDNLGNTESGNPTIDDTLTLTITVTDADDPGTVTITGTTHVDATLTASVTDPDGMVSSVTWKWARADTANGPFTTLTGKTASTYTLVADDLDKYLRATASYTDPLGSGRTAASTTDKVVANPNTMPEFASDTAARTVAENTTSGNVGAVVTATDTDSDTLTYSVAATSETDAAANLTDFNRDFALNSTTGQITVKATAQIDFETRSTYKVVIQVTDSEDNLGNTESGNPTIDDTLTLTITVTNADDPGTITISGIPHIDATLTASVTDPDGSVSSITWKWARGNTASGPFTTLTGETAATYTVVDADLDKFLRATATYTDALGSNKTAAAITTKVTASPHTRPAFATDTAARTVAENTTSGNVGAVVTATDVDSDTLAYSVAATTETDGAAHLTAFNRDFALSSTTGQITVKAGAAIDYETRTSYKVLIQVTDSEDNLGNTESGNPTIDDSLTLTITVTNADDPGTVTITGTAHVDATLTASVSDPDGTASSITWKWARASTANGPFTDLPGETATTYTVVAGDLNKFLRATASYTDPLAANKTASATTEKVTANPNTMPKFASDTASRTVAENTTSGNVGAPITATDTDGDTRTYSVAATSDADAAANLTAFNRDFALNAATGQITVKAGAQIDYEMRSTYKVLIQVTDSEDNLGNTETGNPTIDDTLTLTITVTNANDPGTVTITGTTHVDATLTASVTDPDGTASSITWKWARGDTANGPFTDISTATSSTYTLVADDLNKFLRATASYTDPLAAGKTASATTAKVVANPNTMPEFADATATRTVAENTTSGNVGDAITATDSDSDTRTYSVAATSDADAAANLTAFNRDFALNAATGQITVKSGAQIDYETRTTYKVVIEVTDSEDNLGNAESGNPTIDDTLTLTITVTNADDPGEVAISGIPHIDATLTASVTDPDGSVQSITWKWARGNSASGPFTDLTGETASTYTVVAADLDKYLRATATYTDAFGSGKSAEAVTSKVTASPHTVPAFSADTAARTVAENTTSGNVGDAITANDVDSDTLTYSVVATSETDAAANLTDFNRDFALNATTGQITVKAGAAIDYETRSTYKVVIQVTDSEDNLGNTETGNPTIDDTITLTITVTDADDAGTVTITGTAHVDATLTASVTDPDGSVSSITWKWARGDSANGSFTDIPGETAATYTVVAGDLNKFLRATASYTDPLAAGKTASATTAKVVANPNTVPKFASDTASRTVAENKTSGNVGAVVTATDTDGDTLAYSVAATSETDAADNLTAFNRDFALNAATGQITAKAGAQIDYETRTTYKVLIEVTDSEDNLGNTETGTPTIDDTLTLTITVTDADDPGTVTITGTTHVDATLTASVTDPDGMVSSVTWKWARADTANGPFTTLTGKTGSTYTLVADDLDKYLRATASYTDPLGSGRTAAGTTDKVVANPNTMPEFASDTAARTVAENTTSGNVGAVVTATDTDSDTLTYSVAATSDADAAVNLTAVNRDFALNAATGQITVKATAQIDFETRSTYKVVIQVTDSEDNLGNSESGNPTIDDTLTLTITVTNADDPGEAAISGIPHIDATLTASVTDPDGSVSSITWKWARGNTASGPFTTLTGETAATYTVVDADLDKFLRATATYTDALGSNKTAAAITTKVTASPHTRPAFANATAARTVAENTTSGNVGATITATDVDSDTLTYSIAATSETDGAANLTAFNRDFALSSTTGQIRVKAGAKIDYETRSTYRVLVQVTDSEDNLGNTETGAPTIDDSLTLTITVTNADDPGEVTISGTAHVDATLTASVSDPDGTASSITWKWARASTANGPYTDISTATSATYTVVAGDLNKFLRATTRYTDPLAANKTASATTAKVVANPNTVPAFASDTASRTVAENTNSGNVGAVVTATDSDGDTLAYSVAATSETDAADNLTAFNRDFSLNSATGQITVKATAQIDYETRASYKVLIEVTDGEDNLGNTETGNPTIDDSLTLTITVTDANDPGTVTITGTTHVDATLTASVTDPDGAASSITWKWARGDTASGPFTDIATATSATYTLVADDLDKYLRATASYTDPLGSGRTAAGTTDKVVANPNTVPEFADATATRTVAENTTSGNVGAAITATDTDGDTRTYSVAATSDADAAANLTAFNRDFALNATTGQITVKSGAQIDYETRSTYKVLIEVTDSEDKLGNTESGDPTIDDTLTLTITVTNADDAGEAAISGIPHIDATLTASVTDPDGSVSSITWKWARGNTASGPFTTLTGETATTYTVVDGDLDKFLRATATYTDALGSNKTAAAITTKVTASPHTRPAFANATAARTVAENTTSGNVGATITATDVDSDTLTYSVAATTETDGAAHLTDFNRDFALSSTTGQIRVKAGAQIDYETRSTYKVLIQVTDSEDNLGNTESGTPTIDDTITLTITVTNADEAGTVTISGAAYVDATLTASVTDPDGTVSSVSWRWARASTANGAYTDIATATSADYTLVDDDLNKFLRATATYTDAVGSGKTASATTARVVANPHTRPAFSVGTASRTIAENTTSGSLGAAITATDSDGDTLTYSVAATSETDAAANLADFNRDFALNSATGQITVMAGAQIDYETRSAYKVVIEVTDGEDSLGNTETGTPTVDDTLTLTITVTNVDDMGELMVQGEVAAGLPLAVELFDRDGGVSEERWQWAWSTSQTGEFTDIPAAEGGDQQTYMPREADVGRWLRATVRYTDAEGTDKQVSQVTRTPVLAVPAPPEDRALWRRVSFARDRETAYYSLAGLDHRVSVAEGSSVTVLVRLDRTQVLRPYSVPITVEHGGGASADDYRITPASVSFQPGALFASFTVEAVGDGVDDDNEYLILSLDVPDGLRAGHVTTLRVDLVDDPEDLPPARLSFAPAALSGDEGDWVTATVTLGAPPDEWISNWSVLARLEVSSTLENAENVHLARVDGTQLRFSAGKMTDTVRVQCGSDRAEGPGHRVTVRLGGVTAGSRRGGPRYPLELETGAGINHELVVDCADAHQPADLVVRMSVASDGPWYRPSESSGPATVVVALNDPADREVTIPIETVHHGGLSGDDYSGVPGEVTFGVGQQTAAFEIWAVDDDTDDNDEWLEIRLGALPAGVALASGQTYHSAPGAYWDRSRYAIEIIDDDDTPVTATSGTTSASVSFAGTARSVEPGEVVTVTVDLNRLRPFGGTRVQQQVTVPLAYSYGGGATEADWGSGVRGADALPTDLVFEPGQRYHKFRLVAVGPHTPDSPKTITIAFGTLPEGVTAYSDDDHHDSITIIVAP